MKALGIVRKLDELGRIVIPKNIRDMHGWEQGTPMEMFMSDKGLVIRKYQDNVEKQQIINDLQHAIANAQSVEGKVILQRALEFIKKN